MLIDERDLRPVSLIRFHTIGLDPSDRSGSEPCRRPCAPTPEDGSHGDGVVGAREDLDLVPRADIALLNESQVSTRGRCPCEPLRESGISHRDAELEARDARRGHLEDSGPNAPTLADDGVGDVQVSDREVLAQCARGKGSSELTSPPVEVGEGIGVALRVRLT